VHWAQALPPASLRWAETQADGRALAALPMEGRWLANHLLVMTDGRELVLRRWARPGWEVDDPDLNAAREALVLGRLADTDVPAPELVAVDAEGATCDVPALLITRLPGTAFPGRPPVGPLVDVLAQIHAVDPEGIPPYRRYHEPDRLRVPTWADDRTVWEDAIALAHEAPPELPERFIHRDFHPGNTLWEGAELTGVVDWTTGSRGPAAVDLGHLRWNLVVDYGQRVADALLPHDEHHPYYDVVTALDVLEDLPADAPHAELLRLEEYVARALAEL
jgi:aminoglycoside phosphotransferase (APT) family kinase protein